MQMVLSQLFFSIVWILSWIELQNIVEVQIWQILAVTLAGKTISLRFDITVCYEVCYPKFLQRSTLSQGGVNSVPTNTWAMVSG